MYGSAFTTFWLIVLIVYLVVSLVCASFMAKAAEEKGYPDIHAFAICFWLGIFGYMYIIALPDKYLEKQVDTLISTIEKSMSSGGMVKAETKDDYFKLPEL